MTDKIRRIEQLQDDLRFIVENSGGGDGVAMGAFPIIRELCDSVECRSPIHPNWLTYKDALILAGQARRVEREKDEAAKAE